MLFSEKLRALIEERELTQKEAANQLHMPVSTLGGYVQGTSEPDFQTLMLLASFFDVSTDYLLGYCRRDVLSDAENAVLCVFRALTPEQQRIYIEQGKAFLKNSHHKA